MTEPLGGGDTAGDAPSPADANPTAGRGPERPAEGGPNGSDMQRGEPLTDAVPSAMPEESTLTPSPDHDTGTIVPDQLPDAPSYLPSPMGMTGGGIMPPADPSDIPSTSWITTAPQPAPRQGRLPWGPGTIVFVIVLIALVAIVVARFFGIPSNGRGQILFGTAAGSDPCSVSNQATTLTRTDPVFFAAKLNHTIDGTEPITFKIARDGQQIDATQEPAYGKPFDCYYNTDALTLDPGTYVFTVIHNGDVEAAGTLTVT